jgi:hypothetical protein
LLVLNYKGEAVSARFDTLFSGLHFVADGFSHTICVNSGIARPWNPG